MTRDAPDLEEVLVEDGALRVMAPPLENLNNNHVRFGDERTYEEPVAVLPVDGVVPTAEEEPPALTGVVGAATPGP